MGKKMSDTNLVYETSSDFIVAMFGFMTFDDSFEFHHHVLQNKCLNDHTFMILH